jgi:hypothetical protein
MINARRDKKKRRGIIKITHATVSILKWQRVYNRAVPTIKLTR